MLAKAIAIFALVAAVNGGLAPAVSYLAADPHIGAQSEQTVRGFGGLSSVSSYSKAVDSPFSSVRKTDTRVTNDAFSAYAAPAYAHHGYAAPALGVAHHGYAAAPVAAVAHHGYAAPALGVAHHGYAAAPVAAVAHHGYAAPALHAGYAAPAVHAGYAAPALGHHYSAVSPAVATYSFSGLGLGTYGY